jgi:hypothetical protein
VSTASPKRVATLLTAILLMTAALSAVAAANSLMPGKTDSGEAARVRAIGRLHSP